MPKEKDVADEQQRDVIFKPEHLQL